MEQTVMEDQFKMACAEITVQDLPYSLEKKHLEITFVLNYNGKTYSRLNIKNTLG